MALTNAQRQARHRAKLRQQAQQVVGHCRDYLNTKPTPEGSRYLMQAPDGTLVEVTDQIIGARQDTRVACEETIQRFG